MSFALQPLIRAVQIAAARLYFLLGWPGCVGVVCMAVTLPGGLWLRHMAQPMPLAMTPAVALTTATDATAAPALPALQAPVLPHAAGAVQILRMVKDAAQASGLAWPQAEYRVTPLSDEALATLEIRTTLKGSYPKLRQLVGTLLDKEPALALRELTITRPNGDTPEVEAKIRWVVFLADGWPPASHGGAP
ncbi:MAG: hypothetical protein Q7U28_13110 [Aquabacterium sp.]|nr:hypothetical protein [Aquabacterium sp.]